jgi:hypothetical protein
MLAPVIISKITANWTSIHGNLQNKMPLALRVERKTKGNAILTHFHLLNPSEIMVILYY